MRVKTPCLPVLAIQSYWQVDGTVIIVENIDAKSRTATEALGRPIAVYSYGRLVFGKSTSKLSKKKYNLTTTSPEISILQSCKWVRIVSPNGSIQFFYK